MLSCPLAGSAPACQPKACVTSRFVRLSFRSCRGRRLMSFTCPLLPSHFLSPFYFFLFFFPSQEVSVNSCASIIARYPSEEAPNLVPSDAKHCTKVDTCSRGISITIKDPILPKFALLVAILSRRGGGCRTTSSSLHRIGSTSGTHQLFASAQLRPNTGHFWCPDSPLVSGINLYHRRCGCFRGYGEWRCRTWAARRWTMIN